MKYQTIRTEDGASGQYDWWQLPNAVRKEFAHDVNERLYRHVVIDEAQDLPPEAIRSLVEMIQPGGSVTMFADYAQQLYGQRATFEACGLRIRQPERFTDNYRNSKKIAQLALAMSAMPHFTDSPDIVQPRSPVVEGTTPTLYHAPNISTERATVREAALEFGRTGSVAILGPTWNEARWYAPEKTPVRHLKEDGSWVDGPGIYIGTYHSAKGLEFDAIIMPGVEATAVPQRDHIEAFGDDEARERDSRLLYVGITRARAELLVSYVSELTPLLPGADTGLWNTQS